MAAIGIRKPAVVALACVAVAVSGFYLSGVLSLLLLEMEIHRLQWNTWYRYLHAIDLPQLRPYAGRIRIAGYVGFGLPALAGLALLWLILRPARRSTHGDARFATRAELAAKGLFKPSGDGIVVGRCGGDLVRLGGQQFVILAAPTRIRCGATRSAITRTALQGAAAAADTGPGVGDLSGACAGAIRHRC